MGVVIGNVKCLKYDKNDSKFYGKGAFVGDIVNVWLNNGTRFRGRVFLDAWYTFFCFFGRQYCDTWVIGNDNECG